MKYKYLKKINDIEIIFNNSYLILMNTKKNVNHKIFLNYDFIFLKINLVEFFYFKNFIERSKFLNIIKKSFLSVTRGFCMHLDLIGLGYSVSVKIKNQKVRFNIGYNHSVYYNIPNNFVIRSKRKRLYLFCYSFFLLKTISIDLKNFRRLSTYKLKGIKDKNELYIKKN